MFRTAIKKLLFKNIVEDINLNKLTYILISKEIN
jgi:hypothetical protein